MTNAKQDDSAKAKAAGQHIPAPPTETPAETAPEATKADAFTFTPAGEPAPPPPAPEPAPTPAASDDDFTWTDEPTALGRRIALSRGGSGVVTTYEEVLPLGSNDAQADAAKSRLRARIEAQ